MCVWQKGVIKMKGLDTVFWNFHVKENFATNYVIRDAHIGVLHVLRRNWEQSFGCQCRMPVVKLFENFQEIACFEFHLNI